jgi:GNAT superfamily N-acetyltransferase
MTPPAPAPPPQTEHFRLATHADLPALLPRVREFYAHFAFPWDESRKRERLSDLLRQPDLGHAWLLTSGAQHLEPAGYALVVYPFSLEFDGRIALLDEFFVAREHRGSGIGGRFLDHLARHFPAGSIRAIRLELDARHPEAGSLYARHGFARDGRELWTRRIN